MTDLTSLKRAAAAKALDYVKDGMKLGLGSGSTAELFVDLLAPRVRGGLKLLCVPTSERTAERARKLGITMSGLDDLAPLDLTIDGADEADRNLDLIKGGGGMLLQGKDRGGFLQKDAGDRGRDQAGAAAGQISPAGGSGGVRPQGDGGQARRCPGPAGLQGCGAGFASDRWRAVQERQRQSDL